MSGHLQPGDLPRYVTASERRRWAADDARDADRAMNLRPNIDPNEPSRETVCKSSKYGKHRIVVGREGASCEFCLLPARACRVQP